MQILGIDIGGSGIKGRLVDVQSGDLIGERHRIATPQPATPTAVATVVDQLVRHFNYSGPIGVTFPAIVRHGVTLSAANVDPSWIGAQAQQIFEQATGQPVHVLNDADAAGVASPSSSPLAPESAVPSFTTASCCPTPNSAMSRCR
jgi:polyphosphate glucokinase